MARKLEQGVAQAPTQFINSKSNMGAKTTFEVLDSSRKSSLLPEIEINLYRSMLRIRNAEETLAELYKEKEIRTQE